MELKRNFVRRTNSNVTNGKNHKFRHEMTLTARNYINRSQNGRRKRNEKSKQTDKEMEKKLASQFNILNRNLWMASSANLLGVSAVFFCLLWCQQRKERRNMLKLRSTTTPNVHIRKRFSQTRQPRRKIRKSLLLLLGSILFFILAKRKKNSKSLQHVFHLLFPLGSSFRVFIIFFLGYTGKCLHTHQHDERKLCF